ncbi:hypothetical protein D3C80_1248930 [compost metagenome]
MLRPAARMASTSAWDNALHPVESAKGMPVACRCRACSQCGRTWFGDSRLAAEWPRKYSTAGSLPSSQRALS